MKDLPSLIDIATEYENEVVRLDDAVSELVAAAEDFLIDHRNGLSPDPERLAALVLKYGDRT